ncbi:hypothetical protein ACSBR2_017458 [Camellia fascicularis]
MQSNTSQFKSTRRDWYIVQERVLKKESTYSTSRFVKLLRGGKVDWVHNDDEVRALFKQVQGEVPGSPIFIMKLASQSRHLEVQLLCDQYGNVAALHSRDCSVQRRHQKIIEEGPITVAPLEMVKKLEQAARRLAKCVNYVGAATVECLYSMDTVEYLYSMNYVGAATVEYLYSVYHELSFKSKPNVWAYFSVKASELHEKLDANKHVD